MAYGLSNKYEFVVIALLFASLVSINLSLLLMLRLNNVSDYCQTLLITIVHTIELSSPPVIQTVLSGAYADLPNLLTAANEMLMFLQL